MQASSGAATAVIEGNEAVVDVRATITLPGGVYPDLSLVLSSATVDAQMVTDVPDNTGRPTGYPARSLDLVLSGLVDRTDETKTAFWLFNPANAASPLYRSRIKGSAVTLDMGVIVAGSVTAEFFRKFTGQVDDVICNPDGTVAVACIDNRSLLRGTANLPAVVTAPPYNSGLTSEFAVDALFRAQTHGGISSWPAQRPQCILAAGMRASLWPEVGSLVVTSAQPIPTFAPGVFGSGLAQAVPVLSGLSNVSYQTSTPIGTSVFLEFWLDGVYFPPLVGIGDAASLAFGFPLISCQVTSTTITVTPSGSLGGTAFTWTTTTDGGPHYIAFLITFPAVGGTAWSATIYKDAASSTSGAKAFTTARGSAAWSYITAFPQTATIEALQVTTETAPVLNNTFTPTGVFDPSLNPMQVAPAVVGDPWAALQQIAEAEVGVAGFDEHGVARFSNRVAFRGGTAVRTILATTSILACTLETVGAATYNRIQVPCVAYLFSLPQTAWAMSTVTQVPRNAATTVNVVTDTLVCALALTDSGVLADGSTNPTGLTLWRACSDQYGVHAVTSGVHVTISNATSAGFTLTVTNANTFPVWLVSGASYLDTPAGTPCLQVGGITVTPGNATLADAQWPPAVEGGAASSSIGEINYVYPDNPWRQNPAAQQLLADDSLCDLRREVAQITNLGLVPDPRLQLGDRVTLVDTVMFGLNDDVVIYSLNEQIAAGQYDQTAGVRLVAPFGGMILGVDGRSELGVNTYV